MMQHERVCIDLHDICIHVQGIHFLEVFLSRVMRGQEEQQREIR